MRSLLRMRFDGAVRRTRTGFIVHPVVPGEERGPRTQPLMSWSAARQARLPIDGSHPRLRFSGIANGRIRAESDAHLRQDPAAPWTRVDAGRSARPFYGPANSGVHRSTEWLRPEGMRRTPGR